MLNNVSGEDPVAFSDCGVSGDDAQEADEKKARANKYKKKRKSS